MKPVTAEEILILARRADFNGQKKKADLLYSAASMWADAPADVLKHEAAAQDCKPMEMLREEGIRLADKLMLNDFTS